MTRSRYDWNTCITGSLVTFDLYISHVYLKVSNTMPQTHAVFDELARYGSESYDYLKVD